MDVSVTNEVSVMVGVSAEMGDGMEDESDDGDGGEMGGEISADAVTTWSGASSSMMLDSTGIRSRASDSNGVASVTVGIATSSAGMPVVVGNGPVALRGTAVHFLPSMEVKKPPGGRAVMT